MPINVSFLQDLLTTVAEQGRQYLPSALGGPPQEDVGGLAKALLSGRGEASGVAIARELLDRYRTLGPEERRPFFRVIADEFKPNPAAVKAAAEAFLSNPGEQALIDLRNAVESPRQEFFRRLNLAPGATAEIVAMRRDLLRLKGEPGFAAVDDDMAHLFASWFNRGFLVLRRIDWQTPAAILEKIIRYEAVHEIQGWEDLRRRLEPADRRCFAFFHPSLIDEPLIFVEVALTRDVPGHIQNLIGDPPPHANEARTAPTTAVFYSISNCQEGLRGISFGNFLIKQVVEELAREQPQLKTFVTLSPVPTFARWLDRMVADEGAGVVTDADRVVLQMLSDPGWIDDPEEAEALKPTLLALAAHYFLQARSHDSRPIDPVARFHLGNGARLERINWLGDVSEKGLREAHGLMVNYLYELKDIERNHEAFANDGEVVASRNVKSLIKPQGRSKAKPEPKAIAAKSPD
ncbi:MAG: malonyl-CoA decarboxylase [Hyphomicrobiaceae bacterium]